MSRFKFDVTCLQCGGPVDPVQQSNVTPIEAFIRVVCRTCRAGATLRVLYANRNETPIPVRSID